MINFLQFSLFCILFVCLFNTPVWLRKGDENFYLDNAQDRAVHVGHYYISFLPATFAFLSIWLVCTNQVRMEKQTVHPIPTLKFKKVLRTFETVILKIFNNIQPPPPN